MAPISKPAGTCRSPQPWEPSHSKRSRRHALPRASALHRFWTSSRARQRVMPARRHAFQPGSSHTALRTFGPPLRWRCRPATEKDAAAKSIEDVEGMISRLGIARGLRNHGIPRESLESLSVSAFDDSCHKTNIRPCTQADLLALYEESWR
jgi:hypothetical protein